MSAETKLIWKATATRQAPTKEEKGRIILKFKWRVQDLWPFPNQGKSILSVVDVVTKIMYTRR